MMAVAALLVDYTVSLKNTRKFEPQLKVMRVLGIDEYDRCGGLDKLIINMQKALAEFKLKWKTLDMQRIEEIMRLCIVRELQMIEERKDASAARIRYLRRMRLEALAMEKEAEITFKPGSVAGQSSPSKGGGSPSPTKGMKTPDKMFGGRDLNSTGMGIKSIGGSSDGKMNKSFLNLEPTIGTGILKRQAGGSLPKETISKGGLTASALRNLDNKSTNSKGILKSDAGRTADRKLEGMSRGSRKSAAGEVVYDREEINKTIE